jgi:pyridoxal phosphate-dependent aminotransferase EpsN
MHLQPLYAACARHGGDVAADLYRRGLCLPSSSSLEPADQDRVIEVVRSAVLGRRRSAPPAARAVAAGTGA